MNERLAKAFVEGKLSHPISDKYNFVDLVGTLALHAGAVSGKSNDAPMAVSNFVGKTDHLVFILVDGMGLSLLDLLPKHAFLRSQRMMELRAVFPSTTACALTTLATGLWPGQHGVPGWWAYLDERKMSVITLPFQDRLTETPLETQGVTCDEIWAFPSWMKDLKHDPLSIVPAFYQDSVFTQYSRGYTSRKGYSSISEAFEILRHRITEAPSSGYTYLYLPQFDTACHHRGIDSKEALDLLIEINAHLEKLAGISQGRCRLVISADHGHRHVAASNRTKLQEDDPLLSLLKAPPTGEARTPIFHVRDECHVAFEKAFAQRFSDNFVLLNTKQISEMKLLGPTPLSPLAHKRFGDYMAVAIESATLKYEGAKKNQKPDHISYHAGLSPEEMHVPLIVV